MIDLVIDNLQEFISMKMEQKTQLKVKKQMLDLVCHITVKIW
jgi:hypothetical protein